MYRVPAIAVLLAAAAFPPSLAGQIRTIQRPSGPVQVNVSRFRVPPPSGGLGVMSPRSFGRRASFVRPVPFRHNLHFSISFGNTCFTDPLFDPVSCQQLLFRNQFPFAQPVLLPYPLYTAPYYRAAEQNAPTVADREDDLAREVERLTDEVERLRAPQAAPEPLLLEWHGDHWICLLGCGGGRFQGTFRSGSPVFSVTGFVSFVELTTVPASTILVTIVTFLPEARPRYVA